MPLTSVAPDSTDSRPVIDRLESVDLLRGWVMILMALDHTRDFFTRLSFSPVDLQRTTLTLFLTRWVTHFCAPVFVFLAGMSAFLSLSRGRTRRQLSWMLVSRGLWLALLEVTYVNWFGWSFHIQFHWFGLQVIWALGWSMVVLAGLLFLPRWVGAGFGLCLVVFHNALDSLGPERFGSGADLWRMLHAGGVIRLAADLNVGVGYPLIPWVGVMAIGYAFGLVLLQAPHQRRTRLIIAGAALSVLFVLVRAMNLYGDPRPWTPQLSVVFTVFSFLNCEKYPPSLCYLLMTLGPALLVLALFDHGTPPPLRPVLIFGRVPLFFYLLHLPLIHGASLLARHWASATGSGFGLGAVYAAWIVIMVLLYLPCRWFADLKRSHRAAWLSYF